MKAYEERSDDERLLLLSDIPVKSDISGQDRRLGTDLPTTSTSSTDPDLVLDLMA